MAFDRIIKYDIIYVMTPEKEKFYEKATRKLLDTVDKMGLDEISHMRAKNLVLLFRDSFKLRDVKNKTLAPYLGDKIKDLTYDSDGFCRAASINFALMMGGKDWQVRYIDSSLWTYGSHYFLMHIPSKTVLDLTYDQFEILGLSVPYEFGHKIDYSLDNISTKFAKALNLTPLLNNQKG